MARILIVDDDEDSRKLIATLLGYEGHTAFEARDGMSGLEIARAEHPDLIISDVLMPAMDGFEFVRRLRADRQLSNVVVIFLTGHFFDERAQALARSCKVAHTLPKPFESTQLLGTVREALTGEGNQDYTALTESFSGEHLRLLTNKLAEKVQELQAEVDERRRAQERIQRLNRVYALLSGINSLIIRATAHGELCEETCRLAVQHGEFEIAWIGLIERTTGRLQPAAWAGDVPDLRRFARHSCNGNPQRNDIVSQALASKAPVVCNDLHAPPLPIVDADELLRAGFRALAVLPLVIGNANAGCMMLVTRTPEFFDAEELRLLAELAGDVAFALDHIAKSERLDYLAYFDSLTGLANRALFQDRLAQHLDNAARRTCGVALVMTDIERLAAVNDALGRHVGDQLLRLAATRLASCVGNAKDVGRLSSNHFIALISDVRSVESVIHTVEGWYRDWSRQLFVIESHEIALSAKFGIALYPGDGKDIDTLLRNAETALKKAKGSVERIVFYTQHLSEARSQWLALENKLRRALEHNEFLLHYQPKVDMETRRLHGMEALIRWRSPDLGTVPPARFIPVLEETGLITEVGAWVIRQANSDRARWLERGLRAPRVAVNVSTVQLGREDFVRTIAAAVAGSEPGIDIEVTESLLMSDVESNIEKLTQIRQLGIGIAIDDFGTGYSSLAYLAKLPVETLKIDRSFIAAMLDDPGAMTLVSTIISLAHSLKLDVIAEGVESEEQAKILRLLRCEQMQGFLVSKPLSFEELTPWLSHGR